MDELQLGTTFAFRQFVYHEGQITPEHKTHEKVKSIPTTQLVSRIILSNGTTVSYDYDAEERITSVTESYTVAGTSVTNTTLYTYDALGQLLTETVNGEVVNSMGYDNYGNITKKNGKTYTYGNTVWKDLLTKVGTGENADIVYDAQGNPTQYLGHTLTWEKGRQLKSFDSNTYTYNANGIRTSKTVNGVKHTYMLEGSKILCEKWENHTLLPLYDNEEGVCGVLYDHVPYYFAKNLQGDVIAILDKDAQTVARYSYDAWGVCTNATTYTDLTNGIDIATVNPFRYRSYYYDKETSLYYLQSRYYDAGIGRFISADNPEIVSSALNTANMSTNKYCYCQNSPSNDTDECGSTARAILKMIGNFIFGFFGGMSGWYLANVTINLAERKENIYEMNDTWGIYIAEGVKSGASSIFGNKVVYQIITVVGAAVLKQFIDYLIGKSSFNYRLFLRDIIIGIAFVALTHIVPTALKKLTNKNKKISNKWLAKLKGMVKKIADFLINKLRNSINKLISFFKNTFVKRFSISYAKRIGKKLLEIFSK